MSPSKRRKKKTTLPLKKKKTTTTKKQTKKNYSDNYMDLSNFYFKIVQRMRPKQANLKVDVLLVTLIEKRVAK